MRSQEFYMRRQEQNCIYMQRRPLSGLGACAGGDTPPRPSPRAALGKLACTRLLVFKVDDAAVRSEPSKRHQCGV